MLLSFESLTHPGDCYRTTVSNVILLEKQIRSAGMLDMEIISFTRTKHNDCEVNRNNCLLFFYVTTKQVMCPTSYWESFFIGVHLKKKKQKNHIFLQDMVYSAGY